MVCQGVEGEGVGLVQCMYGKTYTDGLSWRTDTVARGLRCGILPLEVEWSRFLKRLDVWQVGCKHGVNSLGNAICTLMGMMTVQFKGV